MGVKFFSGLGLSKVMTSYLTVSDMTFYIPLKRKLNVDQLLLKELGLKMYGTEAMTSYSDVTVKVL